MPISVCLACDDNYCQHLGVTIKSVLKNFSGPKEPNFFVLNNDISEENKKKLAMISPNISYISINEDIFKNFPLYIDWTNIVTYYRLSLESLLPQVETVLYLDCDVVVLDDISKLFNEDIEDYYAAAVEDIHSDKVLKKKYSFYVNAGVMLFNLKKMREDNIESKYFDSTHRKNHFFLYEQDQSMINFVMEGKIKRLPYKWNVQSSTCLQQYLDNSDVKDGTKNPSIIHFKGTDKPWKNPNIPGGDVYFSYLKETPFF